MTDEIQNEEAPQLSHEEQVDAHNAAMLQRQIDDGKFTLPEQFESAEEFLKAYKSIQSGYTKSQQENARLKEEQEAREKVAVDEGEKPPVKDLAQELLQPANEDVKGEGGLDWDAINGELSTTGTLSEGTQKAMIEANIPQAMIDSHIEAHKAKVEAGAREAADLVGGQENLKDLLAWGRANLSEADQQVLAEQLRGPGWKLALMGLQTLRGGAKPNTNEPKTEIGGGPAPVSNTKVEPFATRAEMGAAMNDPRYGRDKEYTEHVYARTLASQGTLINASLVDKRIKRFG